MILANCQFVEAFHTSYRRPKTKSIHQQVEVIKGLCSRRWKCVWCEDYVSATIPLSLLPHGVNHYWNTGAPISLLLQSSVTGFLVKGLRLPPPTLIFAVAGRADTWCNGELDCSCLLQIGCYTYLALLLKCVFLMNRADSEKLEELTLQHWSHQASSCQEEQKIKNRRSNGRNAECFSL